MLLAATEIGLFRANPNAHPDNNIKLVDPSTPGTSGTDTLDAFDIATGPSVKIDGIRYTGKDGVEALLLFKRLDNPTAEAHYYSLEFALTTAAEVQAAIHYLITQHEVDPVVTVTVAGTEWTFVHVGAGTVTEIVIDGADESATRT